MDWIRARCVMNCGLVIIWSKTTCAGEGFEPLCSKSRSLPKEEIILQNIGRPIIMSNSITKFMLSSRNFMHDYLFHQIKAIISIFVSKISSSLKDKQRLLIQISFPTDLEIEYNIRKKDWGASSLDNPLIQKYSLASNDTTLNRYHLGNGDQSIIISMSMHHFISLAT